MRAAGDSGVLILHGLPNIIAVVEDHWWSGLKRISDDHLVQIPLRPSRILGEVATPRASPMCMTH